MRDDYFRIIGAFFTFLAAPDTIYNSELGSGVWQRAFLFRKVAHFPYGCMLYVSQLPYIHV